MPALTTRLLSLAACTLLLGACHAKITGGDDAAPPAAGPFENKVSGPSLDGKWKSGCERDMFWSNGYIVYSMTISGQNMIRTEDVYPDSNCTPPSKTSVHTGLWRYSEAKKNMTGVYEVNYRLSPPSRTGSENIRLSTTVNTLYISGYVTGDAYPDIALTKQP